MIITRSPLRISLGGGGTDLKSYYSKREGFLIAGAINKYIYSSIIKPFKKGIFLKYSKNENVKHYKQIQHSIIRESLKKFLPTKYPQIEIVTLADIPSGTGLGSSSSFTNSLIKGLHAYNNLRINKPNLAKESCYLEIDKLNQPIGKQDQYISSYGGLKKFFFKKNGKVIVKDVDISKQLIKKFESKLCLIFTGYARSANDILVKQKVDSNKNNKQMLRNLDHIKYLGRESLKSIENNNFDNFGYILNEHWLYKKERSKKMTNDQIDYLYDLAMKNGALGGKVVGAGGGGFLLFYTNDKPKLLKAFNNINLEEVEFQFDFDGTILLDS